MSELNKFQVTLDKGEVAFLSSVISFFNVNVQMAIDDAKKIGQPDFGSSFEAAKPKIDLIQALVIGQSAQQARDNGTADELKSLIDAEAELLKKMIELMLMLRTAAAAN
ncbi:MAG: hypothetical protein HQ477_11520 [Chloroflexi bacterium]|nr:hypothetical protein [Chloroflexota bacterium]